MNDAVRKCVRASHCDMLFGLYEALASFGAAANESETPTALSIRVTNRHRVVARSHNYADDRGGQTRQSPKQRRPR